MTSFHNPLARSVKAKDLRCRGLDCHVTLQVVFTWHNLTTCLYSEVSVNNALGYGQGISRSAPCCFRPDSQPEMENETPHHQVDMRATRGLLGHMAARIFRSCTPRRTAKDVKSIQRWRSGTTVQPRKRRNRPSDQHTKLSMYRCTLRRASMEMKLGKDQTGADKEAMRVMYWHRPRAKVLQGRQVI